MLCFISNFHQIWSDKSLWAGSIKKGHCCDFCFVLFAVLCIVSSDLYCSKDPHASCSLKYFGWNYRRRIFIRLPCFVCFVLSALLCIVSSDLYCSKDPHFSCSLKYFGFNYRRWIYILLRCVHMNLATTALFLVILSPIFVDPALLKSSIEFGRWLACAWLSSVTFASLMSSVN